MSPAGLIAGTKLSGIAPHRAETWSVIAAGETDDDATEHIESRAESIPIPNRYKITVFGQRIVKQIRFFTIEKRFRIDSESNVNPTFSGIDSALIERGRRERSC